MILVTGATGKVGDQVVRTLRSLGQDVRALVRKGSHYYWLNDTGCSYFFGDLRDPTSLSRACRDVRYIVVCSGVGLENRADNHTSVTIDGHRALFEAAKVRGVERIVLISCMGVDRGYPAPGFDARRGAEDLLIGTGLDYSILRACVHEHAFLSLAWRVADNGSAVFPGNGDNLLSPLATQDLARMAAASLDLDTVRNHTIEVGGPDQMTARAAFELACDVVGVPANARTLPSAAFPVARRIGRPFRRYANRLTELHAWFTEPMTVDGAAMTTLFGFPLTDLRASMERSNEWLRVLADPELREKRMVHPQFYATVYEPGTAKLAELPSGPRPPES